MRAAPALALACLTLTLGHSGRTQEVLAPEDRAFLVEYLVRTQKLYADEIAGLSPDQWRFKPLPHRWSVAECAEHIILSEQWLLAEFREKFGKTAEPAYIFHWRKPKLRPDDVPFVPRAERAEAYRQRIAREIDRSKVDPARPPRRRSAGTVAGTEIPLRDSQGRARGVRGRTVRDDGAGQDDLA